jgi:preprotein translocase subunit YajC
MKRLKKIIPHISIILSLMFVVFYIIDRVNSAMNFINHPLSKAVLLALCIFSIITSILLIGMQRKQERRRELRQEGGKPSR